MQIVRTKRWHVLEGLAKQYHWEKGAELGVLDGDNLFYLLDNVPDLHMIGVDRWANYEDYPSKDMTSTAANVIARSQWPKYRGRCIIIHGDTATAAQDVENGSLDFVFIDADHTKDGVVRDIRAWLPKLRKGGKMLGHDIDWVSVREAVEQEFNRFDELADDIWMAVS